MDKEKINKQDKMKQKETITKHGVLFVLTNYPWARVMLWSVIDRQIPMTLREDDFPFYVMYQWQITSWLVVGLLFLPLSAGTSFHLA